ncbi:sodium-coupled monocarboxylate transporter 1 isoform X1 [Chiloscyllium plagiosum]|uniref:sodium-coupled monocarboxylate transporter 1 isoform X1 n=1 Tax=Chiloscyllium plagiosum TaxID=36176 RepID=UPI001CB80E1E|nr:sodium-coupled monocarboxylate transporter 1 isoform X1 [Chiloscyllium plagiosum]
MSTHHTTVGAFTVWDYVVFVIMLLVSASIGVYHAIKARGQQSNSQFLLGDRQLRALPVAMSLTASFMSAVTVIGTPAEVYQFGAMFLIFCISYAIVTIVSAEFFLPVFYRLNITSTYEYLDMRFNKLARYTGTIFYIIQTVLYTGIVIYAPALALNQVTGLDLWGVLVATGLVCTFYCTLGGLKAVVWTDVFQMGIMISGFLAVIIRGVVIQGSFERIWNISYHGGRLNFWDFDPNPLRRHSFWTIVVGGSFMWTAIYGINQSQVQRYIACKNLFEAKLSLYLNLVGLWITAFCAVFTGLTMYSIYHQCDPLTQKKIRAPDQLLPYLVMDILRDYPGVPGLFVAAAYSGTLSTVSSSINALAAVTVEDVIKPFTSLSEQKLAWVTKGLSLMFGIICIGMAALSSLMGSVLQAALTIFGIVGGPLLGLFLLGMIFPCASSIGALSGLAVSFILTLWIGIGGQVYQPLPDQTRPLVLNTAGCFFNTTDTTQPVTGSPWTTINQTTEMTSRPVIADTLYSISYLYLSPIGTMTVLVLGLIISLLTGGKRNTVDVKLLFTYRDMLCHTYLANRSVHSQKTITKDELEGPADTGKVNPTFTEQELNNPEKQDHIISTTYL